MGGGGGAFDGAARLERFPPALLPPAELVALARGAIFGGLAKESASFVVGRLGGLGGGGFGSKEVAVPCGC